MLYLSAVFPAMEQSGPAYTEDGFELTFGTNHLGPFYLTLLLLETLKKTTPSRIVMVSSALHDPNTMKYKDYQQPHLDFDNLQLLQPGTYSSWTAYGNSKLGNVLFTKELSRKLQGCDVTVNSLCPGWIPSTGLSRSNPWYVKCFILCCCRCLCRCNGLTTSLSRGSACVTYVATNQTLHEVTGEYFNDCQIVESSEESNDINVAKQLWDASIALLELEKETYEKV